jgi:dTDP-4-dehydrorhamnose 3,5-epimerase
MKFNDIGLEGACTIDLDMMGDERGFFARTFCVNEFQENGLDGKIVQINNSLSQKKGTLRGIHYQVEPCAETKIVRCLNGSLWDVIVDLRKESQTYLSWYGEELSAQNRKMMYVPKGFGHGFISLEDNTEIIYMVTEFYSPENERGVRWDDPKIGIKWPVDPVIISDKDKSHPDFQA